VSDIVFPAPVRLLQLLGFGMIDWGCIQGTLFLISVVCLHDSTNLAHGCIVTRHAGTSAFQTANNQIYFLFERVKLVPAFVGMPVAAIGRSLLSLQQEGSSTNSKLWERPDGVKETGSRYTQLKLLS
jgi:hypothetical protein